MDVFDLDRSLVADYERFARSFTQVRAPDIRTQIDLIYASKKFWPDPLISINPHFEVGDGIEQLAARGSICAETAHVFRINGSGITLHRHQSQALAKAKGGKSFVVTTGTGSGKSLCFFVPIIEHIIQARKSDEAQRTRAIIIYPMNALANSQMKELEKFLEQSDLSPAYKPTFARYTGQETAEERELIRQAKPDILLTNFMMLELLMTRQKELDKAVISSAEGLDFLVLDELHTYRGRQGADVAMLMRRVRDRLCKEKPPICIGTSATMSSEEGDDKRAATVAAVASRLFGTVIDPDCVIDESLRRATAPDLDLSKIKTLLGHVIDAPIPEVISDDELRLHPLAAWIELEIGLEDRQKLVRRTPVTVLQAAERLSEAAQRPVDVCRRQLEAIMTVMSKPAKERGGKGERAFMAFKLHRFISGAGHVYATLRAPGRRRMTLDGQQFDPQDREARLYSTHFCRSCGQEFHPVILREENGERLALARSIDDAPIEDDESDEQPGYLMPEPVGDADYDFSGKPEDYPEEWLDRSSGAPRLRAERRRHAPVALDIEADGKIGTGRHVWFIPGKFRFCPACRAVPPGQAREYTKLGSLSAEGRSSATTLLVSSTLRWMNADSSSIPAEKRKLLGFTDNRQDAALQAGHFNDFLFVSLLRAATLAAIRKAGAEGLGDSDMGTKVQAMLGFRPENAARRGEWMLEPETKGVAQIQAGKNLVRVLAHRIWADQRRGWRYTNPNLEELGLVRADYLALEALAEDSAAFEGGPIELMKAPTEVRINVLRDLFDVMRKGLAVTTEALDPNVLEEIGTAARQSLREPWSFGDRERPRYASALMVDPPKREEAGVQGEVLIIRGGSRSALAKKINRLDCWGRRLPAKEYDELVNVLLKAAESYQIVRQVQTPFDMPGWRLAADAVRLVPGEGSKDARSTNPYFADLYETLADVLVKGGQALFGFEGREHTAQVDQERRQWRECRFRWEDDDRKKLKLSKEDLRQAGEPDDFLPVLFCSPTMELGVDISALNAVYLRNVPPTPANYAQRSGRAGRSGQAALVITYCSAQGPHDQYYFNQPVAMVSGVVRPPALDLANRDLVEAHLHAVWLAESGTELAADIPHILDLQDGNLPIRQDVSIPLGSNELVTAASAAMKRILKSIDAELTPHAAPWAVDREQFAERTAAQAYARFSDAFNRWRQLYSGARSQLEEANRRSEMHGLTAAERREAKQQQAQANEQITLLERGNTSGSSDFYSYRYLATEGFLPGYNFPRLPLYAFIPAVGSHSKAAYLQRARFLAIAEFGPASLIYHEGRAYRVWKARLPTGARNAEGKLVTSNLYVCEACGAAHTTEVERCHACASAMGGTSPIRNALRIDNVETQAAERITANDEERQRRGFEIQTIFAWPERDGHLNVDQAIASDEAGPILRLDYAPAALISRVNKGLRRRKNKSILGFGIDPATGRWMKGPDEEDGSPEEEAAQRVVPIVQDSKNAMLIRLANEEHDETVMVTLQHALSRGLDFVFQLEEGETMSEPTPSRDNRRAILAFEVSEGGAGVLGRLISEDRNLARVARAALELMHLDNIGEAIAAADPALLKDREDAHCVKGCYRCLLSYFNQPDHGRIDRGNEDVRRILLRLARSSVRPPAPKASRGGAWLEALEKWKLPTPDAQPLAIAGAAFPLVWRAHLVLAVTQALPATAAEEVGNKGFVLVELPAEPGSNPPDGLVKHLGVSA